MMPSTSPALISRSTESTARTPPYALPTPRARSNMPDARSRAGAAAAGAVSTAGGGAGHRRRAGGGRDGGRGREPRQPRPHEVHGGAPDPSRREADDRDQERADD